MEAKHRSLIIGMLRRMEEAKKFNSNPSITMFMTMKGGLSELVDLTASAAAGVEFRKGFEAWKLDKSGGCFRVHSKDGAMVEADAVVLALPAYGAGELVEGLVPGSKVIFGKIPYVTTATVSMGYLSASLGHALHGYGFVIPKTEKRKIMAAWSSSKFFDRAPAGRSMIRCFVGGSHDESLAELDEVALVGLAMDELREIMGIKAKPVMTRVYRWRKAMAQYVIGHAGTVEKIEQAVASVPGLFVAGSAYRGIGISECVRSGKETAEKVTGHLSGSGG
jgi:oxygen-dependent protoporphyrinogen oxidase